MFNNKQETDKLDGWKLGIRGCFSSSVSYQGAIVTQDKIFNVNQM